MNIEIQEGFADAMVIIKCPEITSDIRRLEMLIHSHGQECLACLKDGTTHFIERNEVLYFESVDKHCYLYTADSVYEVQLKLYEIEELLEEAGFIRTSKAQILNIAKIESLCPEFCGRMEVTMDGGEKQIVSRQYAKTLKERLGLTLKNSNSDNDWRNRKGGKNNE